MVVLLVTLVDVCRRYAWLMVVIFLLLTSGCGWFTATYFKMNTDVNTLLAADLPWRLQEKALEKAFPQRSDLLVVVITATEAALAEQAATSLYERMTRLPEVFKHLKRPDALPFFRQNGLLYLSEVELANVIDRLMAAQPLLGALAADQSLRGLFRVLGMMLKGVEAKAIDEQQFAPVFMQVSNVVAAQAQGNPAKLDWQKLLNPDNTNSPRLLRRFILTQPVLDYSALSPGKKATQAVRAMVREAGLDKLPGVTIRLTGSVALNDEEFASVADGMGLAAIGSLLVVIVLLLLALRSVRLVLPILLTLLAGLIITTAFGLAALGSLNLISVAFAVMFIGIAVDFGIQFGVRFRDQLFHQPEAAAALRNTARVIARPLALAAGSTSAGFLAFTPTSYAGVAELWLIAGAGMIIAFGCNLTLLPALISLCRPPPEQEAVGFFWLRPLDNFLHRQRVAVLTVAIVLAIVSAVVATHLRFDFDPLNLKNPRAESVATLFDLAKNLDSTPYTAQILMPDLTGADALATKLRTLPEVARVMTLSSFLPEEQEIKLQLLQDTRMILLATLSPSDFAPAPKAADLTQAAQELHSKLQSLRDKHPSIVALADAMQPLLTDADKLFALQEALIGALPAQLIQIRDLLSAQAVSIANMPPELKEDWMTTDGKARVEIYPRINPRNPDELLAFNRSIQAVAPHASGTTIAIAESGATVVKAFVQAALGAVLIIGLLVFASLRRWFDTLALLAPLLLGGVLTLAICVLLGVPVNFANIIGLPLLLGLGVSFAIYFVSYWREGGSNPLQSSMARAVTFSASTTLVAFGSLALSDHPGTASMGQILTIALLCALASTCLLLPALLRQDKS